MSDDHLQRFATRVVELQERQEKRSGRVDEELMREVARELGMSDEELARVRDESRARKDRARALRAAGSLEPAIAELEMAWAFNPLDVELAYMLADGLFSRARKTGDAGDRQRARDLCLQVLEAAPAHAEAPALLNAIDNWAPAGAAAGAGAAPRGRGASAVVAVAIAGAVLLVIAAVLAFLL
jgi:tetratricopeptide (TPR) repeat protein